MSIEKIKLLTCDWCGKQEHYSRPTQRDRTIRIFMQEKCGWVSIVEGKAGVLDFCDEECKELWHEDNNRNNNPNKHPLG